jgi:mono/diheme cytochrome c family protein/cytochrome bd-type quinol oxidase subunit 1
MNYPVWYLPETGGGLLIALISILHVFVSHFAVGGGLYLIYAEKKGLREKSQPILDFTKKHARFFLLVTMVFGSISGVGIWFIIALVNPAATSLLIHNFVFAWAIEWVFFTVEIGAAFVYYYMFGRMDSRTHLQVGWLYFIAAWMSLLVINGIIGVMLTPGSWAQDMDFWAGFFNPSFFPSLIFRTFIALMIAACYGFLSASFTADAGARISMTRFSAKWALVTLVLALISGLWYLSVLPDQSQGLVMGKSPTIAAIHLWTAAGFVSFLLLMLVAGIVRPSLNLKPIAGLAMISALVVMGGFEWTREAARRPYVINEVMYSNSIMKKDVTALNDEGFLRSALWVQTREVSEENLALAGEEIFINQCYACHTVGGINNDIIKATSTMSYRALVSYINKIHEVRYFMPPFVGTAKEGRALAAYIAGGLHGKEVQEPQEDVGSVAKGPALFEENCASCHALEDVASLQDVAQEEIVAMLRTLNEISDEMEPFSGSAEEHEQLAAFLGGHTDTAQQETTIDGEAVFETHCSMCHGIEEMAPMIGNIDRQEIFTLLGRLDQVESSMPPFGGTTEEQEALADFLASINQGGK